MQILIRYIYNAWLVKEGHDLYPNSYNFWVQIRLLFICVSARLRPPPENRIDVLLSCERLPWD